MRSLELRERLQEVSGLDFAVIVPWRGDPAICFSARRPDWRPRLGRSPPSLLPKTSTQGVRLRTKCSTTAYLKAMADSFGREPTRTTSGWTAAIIRSFGWTI